MSKVDIIVDLQYGSTGKGLIAGYLAKKNKYSMVLTANMPNAGHTFIDKRGRKWVHKVLPNGIVSPGLEVVGIGPGAVFDVERLEKEIHDSEDLLHSGVRLMIHECAGVVTNEHRRIEENSLNAVASTKQGSGAALVEKMMRNPESVVLARDALKGHWLEQFVVTQREWLDAIHDDHDILAEGAQGYSLGLNAGMWPYCTSRDCTPARFMADMGLPLSMLNKVIGTARTYPIRVGNTEGGFSGPHYGDQSETSWEALGLAPELTTVTQRVRRVFTFSKQQIKEAIQACAPDEIFLNFCNYTDGGNLWRIVNDIQNVGGKISYMGYGPREDDVREVL